MKRGVREGSVPVTEEPDVAAETEILASESTNTLGRTSSGLTKVEAKDDSQ